MTGKVSVVIPAYNEEGNIERVVDEVSAVLDMRKDEIIVVNDGSTDKTGEMADELAEERRGVRVIHRDPPNGFGRAVRTGLESATGDILVPVMADMSDDPGDISKLVDKIEEGFDVAIGSRFVPGGQTEGYPKPKLYLGNRVWNWAVRLLYVLPYKDLSNAFKAYRREVVEDMEIESEGFEITAEIVLKALAEGYRVAEVPVRWYGRETGAPKMNFLTVAPAYGWMALKIWPSYVIGRIRRML